MILRQKVLILLELLLGVKNILETFLTVYNKIPPPHPWIHS